MSAATSLIALITVTRSGDEERVTLGAPAVGILRGVPTSGHLLGSGEAFSRLTILDRSHPLLVPEGISGVVTDLAVEGSGADAIAVEYGQPILVLSPLNGMEGAERRSTMVSDGAATAIGERGCRPRRSGTAGSAARGATGGVHAGEAAIPPGCHAVISPADGVFYRRPRPTEAPYVEIGARVRSGQTLALIEAMKCFSAIAYGGPGLPEEAEIVEARAEDASEIRHGQILFVVKA